MKTFNIIFCVVFLFSAALQYNDDDPYIWVPIYGYGAWICYSAARNNYYAQACLIGILIYIAGIAYYLVFKHGVIEWVQQHEAKDLVKSMQADKPWIEESREVLGLLILVIVLSIDWFVAKKRKPIPA